MRTNNVTTKRHRRSLLLSTTLIAAGALSWQGTAQADELVNTDVTGPVVVNGNELLEVTTIGTVTSIGDTGDIYGLDADGDFNTVNNDGTVNVEALLGADEGVGIDLDDNDTANNTGTINVASYGPDAIGIHGNDHNTITNSGAINVTNTNLDSASSGFNDSYDGQAFGIKVDDYNTVSNSDVINVSTYRTGAYVESIADGIDVDNENVITNNSTINSVASVYGFDDATALADGLDIEDDNTVTNTGNIDATAIAKVSYGDAYASADGIEASDNNTIINSGTINANATAYSYYNYFNGDVETDAIGIEANDNNTITNMGDINVNATAYNLYSSFADANADGIEIDDNNHVTNSGNINVEAAANNAVGGYAEASADGIEAENNNHITNSGNIYVNAHASNANTTNAYADGIDVDENNYVSNLGTIYVNAESTDANYAYADAEGIDSDDGNNTIVNSGNIYVTASANNPLVVAGGTDLNAEAIANGINAEDNDTVTNIGMIDARVLSSSYKAEARGINANDNNTITNQGTIVASAAADDEAFARGIRADDNNHITNDGTIDTTSTGVENSSAAGIKVDDNNIVTNSGTINTTATGDDTAFARGIRAEDNNTINNFGTLNVDATSAEADAAGMKVNDGNTISNSGNIFAAATSLDSLAYGVLADDNNNIINTGIIVATATGSEAYGIKVDDNNTIINEKEIEANAIGADGEAFGIEADDENEIDNSGNISANATGSNAVAYGVYLDNQNTFTNSGRILANADLLSDTYAIFLEDDGFNEEANTINLLAPSFLAGKIQLQTSVDDVVNITTGTSHSILWTFDGNLAAGAPNVDGPVAGFWNATTQQFATIDPTSFAATNDWLADRASLIFNGLRARSQAMVPEGDAADRSYDLWFSGLGSISDYDGNETSTMDQDIDQYGFMAGIDFELSGETSLGLLAGYIDSQLQVGSFWEDSYSNSYENDASGFFGGIRGETDMGKARFEAAFLIGQLGHENTRFVNDNLQRYGVGYAEASYNSFWISPEISVSTDIEMKDDLTITPSLRARYAAQWIDGYTETGSSANAVVGEQNAAVGELVAEAAATKILDFGSVTGRVGILGRFGMGDDAVDVTMIGVSNAISTENNDLVAGYLGLEGTYYLSDNASLGISGQAMVGEDFTRFQGAASLGVKF